MADQRTLTHPVGAAVERVREVLARFAQTPVHLLSPEQKADLLRETVAAESQLVQLRMRVMAASDDVAAQHGQRDVAAWVAHQTNVEPSRVRAEQATAVAIDSRWRAVGAAMAAGRLSADQARVICRGLDQLVTTPDLTLDPDVVIRAEADLVAYGTGDHPHAPDRGFSPRQLKTLAERILHVIAPDIADEADARALERLEATALRKTKLNIKALGDGISRVTAIVPDAIAHRLRTYLDAYTSPRQHGQPSEQTRNPDLERLPYPRRLGHAFCALLEHLDPARLPEHGGDATTVIVTMTLEQLRADLASAGLLGAGDDTLAEGRISAEQARRLACTAHLLPAVLGGKGEVLDLGRVRRLFSPAQRRAIRLRDRRCRAEGCTIAATWTEAHHLLPWARGGPTDLDNGISLCNHHHHRAHDRTYTHDRLPNGDLRFHRRR